jgi:putative ABC transport system permease protein
LHLSALWGDARHGLRVLVRNRGATLLAVLCLGLGIGLVTTMFAGADPWLFRPLPYDAPGRLVALRETDPRGTQHLVSTPSFYLFQDESHAFAGVGAVVRVAFNLSTDVEPERIQGALVTASLFPMLGARPVEGRLFTAEEGRPGGPAVCLIGDDLWRRHFAGRPGVVGSTLKIDGHVTTVVGRMAPGWGFPEYAEVWTPLRLDRSDTDRRTRRLDVMARLHPGQTIPSARRELETLGRRVTSEHPETSEGWGFLVTPLLEQLSPPGIRAALKLILAAAGFVLLIACANVANLLLTQGIDRRREIATRLALGAGPGSLLRERLVESLLLAATGGLVGIPLARWGTVVLAGAMPVRMPFWSTMALNPRVLATTVASCVLASLAAGLLPALDALHLDVRSALTEGGRASSAGARSRRLGSVLVAAELSAAVVLSCGAWLMVRSFRERQRFDVGFVSEGALSARLTLGEPYREPADRAVFLEEVLRRARSLPGVEAAAALTSLPFSDELGGGWATDTIEVDGFATPLAARPSIVVQGSTAQGFAALGIAIREGRGFTESETDAGADVAVISEGAAHRFWPGQDPRGRRFRLGDGDWLRVVGVAREVREPSSILGLDLKPPGQVYVPYLRRPSTTIVLVARGRDPEALVGALRQQIRLLDPLLPVYDARTLAEARRRADWVARLWGQLLGWAAVIGALLACVGVYGVVARNVARRTQEIGVRMAMGADRRAVLGLVLGQGLRFSLVGVGAGVLGALLVNRALSGLLYGVSATDPLTLIGSALGLVGVAALATYVPARRATAVNLVTALRAE